MRLLFDYPWYWLLLCVLVAALYSFALYGRPRKMRDLQRKVRTAMTALRFVAVFLLCMLLMAPLVKRHVNSDEKPIVVLLDDVSESVKENLADNPAWKELAKEYDFVMDSFGGKSTDIAAALESTAAQYAGRNLGAIILATDGIYNQGENPLTAAANAVVPVYTVALGDTTRHRDAAISRVRNNKIAYLGNQTPIEITVQAHHMAGEKATLTVTHHGQRLFTKEIRYTGDPAVVTETLTIKADQPGLQSYTITVTPCHDELSQENNSRTIAIEVLDGHQKVAIVAAAPHPDVSALRQSIEKNPNYEVAVMEPDQLKNLKAEDCSLLILHNLPATGTPDITTLVNRTPTLFVVGSRTDLGRLNALHAGLEITAKSHKSDEALAAWNKSFSLFSLDENCCRRLEQMPPLHSPFGTYRLAANTQSLFTARIGSVASDRPLIACGQQGGVRHSFVMGEGLWHWRLQCYQMTGSHSDFDLLVEKLVVYTSLQSNRDRFHVTAKAIYAENEEVVLEGELYDDNFEPVASDAECTIRPLTAGGKEMHYDFSTAKPLNLGVLEPGEYRYSASATLAGKKYTAQGGFLVEALQLEQANLVADHSLLRTMAANTGGTMVMPGELERLPQLLAERTDLQSVIYSHISYTELLDLPWIFILLVLLLAAEWTLRKLYLD